MASQHIALRRVWQLGPELDRGGFGRIYEATGDDGTAAVIKLIPKAPGAARELLFEPLTGSPNVIPILDTGEWHDFYVIVMARAETSLRARLTAAGGPLAVDEVVSILIDMADAGLQGGVVHRDLKPENILLYEGHWCLADFGIARYAEATTAPDTHKYSMTVAYAAPEQWRAQRVSPATDIYAFGIIAFELLQGQRPFNGPDASDFRDQHLNEPPPALANVAPSLAALVSECLFKPAPARPTAANVAARLRASQQPPSPGALRLQNANQRVIVEQSAVSAKASAHSSAEEQRAELFGAAMQTFNGIVERLLNAIAEAAPAAKVDRRSDIVVRLGNALLALDQPDRTPAGVLTAYGRPAPFDVIAHSAIAVKQPRDRFHYEGRGHSLWFSDAHELGVYRWFETAFMVQPFIAQRFTLDPFPLPPTDDEAAGAFSTVMTARQVAWQPVPIDQGEEAAFIERWLGWFAAVVEGSLRHPSSMPEQSGGRHR